MAEAVRVKAWLAQVEATLPVIACDESALANKTLGQALELFTESSAEAVADVAVSGDSPQVAIFSGLRGEEAEALVECWEEYTGLPQPCFASVTEGLMGRQIGSLLGDIVRAARTAAVTASPATLPQYTVLSKKGALQQTNSKEELRGALEDAVKRRQKKHGGGAPKATEDEADGTARALRGAKRKQGRDTSPGRGFQR